MRRLPIYLLIDVSESITENPVTLVENGIRNIIHKLRTSVEALDFVYISILVNSEELNMVTPLTELSTFNIPDLSFTTNRLSTDLMLHNLSRTINATIIKTTSEQKGDWSPSVIIFTDRQIDQESLMRLCQQEKLGTHIYANGIISKVLLVQSSMDFSCSIQIDIPHAVAVGQDYDYQIKDFNVISI